VIKSFKKSIPLEYLTYLPVIGGFTHMISSKSDVLQSFMNKLLHLEKNHAPSFLIFADESGETPFNIAHKLELHKSTTVLLEMLIKF